MRPFREKNLLKITGIWVGRIFKGMPKLAESLIYRHRHLESVRGESIYKHKNVLNWEALPPGPPFRWGFAPTPPYLN